MKNYNQPFDLDSFLSPDVSCAPVYIWVWNDVCTRELIDEQLDEMQRLGIRAFYILPEPKEFRPGSMPTRLAPDYLSPAYFALCAYAIEQGGARGMRCWLYDEGGWPSGGACGAVLRDRPAYARQVLKADERIFSAGEVYRRSSPDVLAAFVRDEQMIEEPYRFAADTVVTEYRIAREKGSAADYPDLLNPDATAYFIRLTHQGYADALKGALGKTVTAVFTDEPKAPLCPFNRELAGRYEAVYGESILPFLPLIAKRKAASTETAPVLSRWYDLCSRTFCENYLLPCKQWANEHGLAFTGHLDKDHDPLGCVRGGGHFHLMRALLAQELPVFTEKQPYYAALPQFNRYLERLSYVASWGERTCDTALYYPVCDFQGGLRAEQAAQAFDALGRKLEEGLTDFDIVDDDVIQAATGAEKGRLRFGGAAYRHVILPENATLPLQTQQVLQRFVRGGGRVSCGAPAPEPAVQVEGEGLRAMRRKAGAESLLLLFREGGGSGAYRVHLPGTRGYLLNLDNGNLQVLETEDGVLPLTLSVGETAVILLTETDLPAQRPQRFGRLFEISGGFRLRKDRELICGENGFEIQTHTDAARPVLLGDWRDLFGAAYSGSGVYETAFSLPDDAIGVNGRITLGDVRFTAAVYLNERLLGTVLAPPYRVSVPAGVLKKENRLKIIVTNTSANWYAATDYFDRWSKKELSPYFEGELSYAGDAASGGLFGPVRLETE